MAASSVVDAYIAKAPAKVRPILRRIRAEVRRAVPDAEELLSYRMPAFRRGGILLYYAAFKSHIGVFPPFSGDLRLERALAPYAGPKGNLRFPLDRPVPYGLIGRLAKARARQGARRQRRQTPDSPRGSQR